MSDERVSLASEPMEIKEAKVLPPLVQIEKDGAVEFNNHNELTNAARWAIHNKIAPESLSSQGPQAVAAALVFCRQRNLPLSAMGKLAYVRGKIQCFGSLVTALVQKHPDFGEMQIYYLDDKQEKICMDNKNLNADAWACVIRILKKSDTEWNEFFFTKDEAQNAGLLSNPTYKKYLKDMLYHRAKSRAFDASYASALEGVEYYEALQDVTEIKEKKMTLNERLNLKPIADEIEV